MGLVDKILKKGGYVKNGEQKRDEGTELKRVNSEQPRPAAAGDLEAGAEKPMVRFENISKEEKREKARKNAEKDKKAQMKAEDTKQSLEEEEDDAGNASEKSWLLGSEFLSLTNSERMLGTWYMAKFLIFMAGFFAFIHFNSEDYAYNLSECSTISLTAGTSSYCIDGVTTWTAAAGVTTYLGGVASFGNTQIAAATDTVTCLAYDSDDCAATTESSAGPYLFPCGGNTALGLASVKREGCIKFEDDSSVYCLSQTDYETVCKDADSCPASTVGNLNTAVIVTAVTLLIFSVIQFMTAVGYFYFKSYHPSDFFVRMDRWQSYLMCCVKQGPGLERYMAVVHIAMVAWAYFQASAVDSACPDAKETDGATTWKFAIYITTLVYCDLGFFAVLLVVGTLLRFKTVVRGELHDPPEDDKIRLFEGEYDWLIFCRDCREVDCFSSYTCYEDSVVELIETLRPKHEDNDPSCANKLRRTCCLNCRLRGWISYECCRVLCYIPNCAFWASCGPVGALFETCALYRHNIGP